MKKDFFEQGTVTVGGDKVSFVKQEIQDQFTMYLPSDFIQDNNLISRYSYFFSQEKSPLSIAIRFTSGYLEDRDRMISHYFSQAGDSGLQKLPPSITYRETVTGGKLSIYSLRFSVEMPEGILFGCFNALASDVDVWKPIVLEMLQHIETK